MGYELLGTSFSWQDFRLSTFNDFSRVANEKSLFMGLNQAFQVYEVEAVYARKNS